MTPGDTTKTLARKKGARGRQGHTSTSARLSPDVAISLLRITAARPSS